MPPNLAIFPCLLSLPTLLGLPIQAPARRRQTQLLPPPHSSLIPSAPDRPARAVLVVVTVTGARLGPLIGGRLNPELSPTLPGPQTYRRAASSVLRPHKLLQREDHGASAQCQGQQEPRHRHLPGTRRHQGPRPCPAPPKGGGRHCTSAPTQPQACGHEGPESLFSLASQCWLEHSLSWES